MKWYNLYIKAFKSALTHSESLLSNFDKFVEEYGMEKTMARMTHLKNVMFFIESRIKLNKFSKMSPEFREQAIITEGILDDMQLLLTKLISINGN